MSLADLIRGKKASNTATPATFATPKPEERPAVAKVATVAVAIPAKPIPATPVKIAVSDTATTSCWWLIRYADGDLVEVARCPEATHAEILEWYPDAIAAKPFEPTIRQPSAPMSASDEQAIRAWLALIEETDPATIAEALSQCRRDADARDYFTGRAAAELPIPDSFNDDRRTCNQCENLIARRCQAAKRGEIVASRDYEPIRDLLRRCEGYAPGVDDPDRRHGRERWWGLIPNGGK